MTEFPKVPKNEQRKRNKILPITAFILFILSIVLGINGFGLSVQIRELEKAVEETEETVIELPQEFNFETAETPQSTLVLQEDGTLKNELLNTFDEIDGGKIEEFDLDKNGQGAMFDVTSPEAFMKGVIDKCISMGNIFGSQCVSLARAFWESYTPRSFSTCNTGKASGAWNCKNDNAGSEFIAIDGNSDLEIGDWAIWGNGQYGHVGMIFGRIKNGYVPVLGENQGGKSCSGGGSSANIVNISTTHIIGVFRPKIYHQPKVPDTGIVTD